MVMHLDSKANNKHPVVLTAHLDQGGTEPTLPAQSPTADPVSPPAPDPAGTRTAS
jgi:hypothetical protein